MTEQDIIRAIQAVSQSPYPSPHFPEPLDCAVMVVLHGSASDRQILFTKRAEHLSSHPGQVSFPGGRPEDSDQDLIHTALRETEEEVGIPAEQIQLAASLTPVTTLTGFRIHPFVGFITQLPELTLEVEEVDTVFHVPVRHILSEDVIKPVQRRIHNQDIMTFRMDWQEYIIWGATANILADLSYRLRQLTHLQLTD